ncbi:MAG: OmpA family protein [Bacteroidales bacterium]|nr:OmpA family protein [Bacteroidales bacterium]
MTTLYKYLLFIFFIFFFNILIKGQIALDKGDIEVRFLKDKVEIIPGKSFFNVLLIKNTTNEDKSFNLKLNTPKGWEVIGDSYEKINLPPLGNIKLPVRVTVNNNAKGGVGYVIVATITDETGSIYDTEYSFLNIPIKSQINIKTARRSRYFDQKDLKSSFSLILENRGNIDEIVNITAKPDISLLVEDQNIFVENVMVEAGTTKTVMFDVQLKNNVDVEKFKVHKIKLNVSANDTVISKMLWFNYLDWKYVNEYPNYNLPLRIELTAFNIFSNTNAKYRGSITGKILLKKRREVTYSFENMNKDPSTNNIYINSRALVSIKTPKTTIFLGDYTGNVEQTMYGRGLFVSQKINKFGTINAVYTQRFPVIKDNYGLYYTHNFKKALTLELGGAYTDDRGINISSKSGYGKLNTRLFNKSRLSMLYGISETDDSRVNAGLINGWGYRLDFSLDLNKIDFKIYSQYGSPTYSGYTKGRNDTRAYLFIPISDKSMINTFYSYLSYTPYYVQNGELFYNRFTDYQQLRLIYFRQSVNNVQLFGGANIDQQRTNNLTSISDDIPFSSISLKGELGIKVYDSFSQRTFSLTGKFGYTNVYRYSEYYNDIYMGNTLSERTYPVSEITFNYKQKHIGLHMIYYNGPYNITQQFSYLYFSNFSKSLNIMPSYENDFFKRRLKLVIRSSYINDLIAKNSRINIMSSVMWHAKKGWDFRFVNTTSYQNTTSSSDVASVTSSYSTTYFEIGIIKSFHFNQPRLKYYNYKAVFYKDLNGNRIHDANEPGVEKVLADIQRSNREADAADVNYNGEFITNELFTNQEGSIEYINMAEGSYTIKYSPKDMNLGTFETDEVKKNFTINSDTVMHIPFLERNKLFGRVSLNRTKHSALGEIPIDNIKIIVEGDNKTYTSLTDKEGNFELYIPVSDYYKVKINNIFYEHFNLRQEYYIVKFNGYKQFELSFDFDEKDRKIAFDESDFLIDDDDVADNDFSFEDIKVIKQTNLRGIVKDANSLIPIHATVSIHNINTHDLISETASSKRTGVYFTSFFAGKDYNIKATSKGYWTYKANLNIQQVTTFENITHDILLKKIVIDEEIKTDNLSFKPENAELSPLAMAELDNMLSILFLNPDIHIEISGHTDNMEALLVNPIELSKIRASSVASYLVKNGLDEARMKIRAMGNSSPRTQDDSDAGRARNRRVEIRVAAF